MFPWNIWSMNHLHTAAAVWGITGARLSQMAETAFISCGRNTKVASVSLARSAGDGQAATCQSVSVAGIRIIIF